MFEDHSNVFEALLPQGKLRQPGPRRICSLLWSTLHPGSTLLLGMIPGSLQFGGLHPGIGGRLWGAQEPWGGEKRGPIVGVLTLPGPGRGALLGGPGGSQSACCMAWGGAHVGLPRGDAWLQRGRHVGPTSWRRGTCTPQGDQGGRRAGAHMLVGVGAQVAAGASGEWQGGPMGRRTAERRGRT